MITSLQTIVISGAQGLLMLMGSKLLIMMTSTQNIVLFLMFYGLVIFKKKFNLINIKKPWALKIAMFCSEIIMTKSFNLSKAGSLGRWFWFHIFINKAFLVLDHSFLHLGCFSFDTLFQIRHVTSCSSIYAWWCVLATCINTCM